MNGERDFLESRTESALFSKPRTASKSGALPTYVAYLRI
jgi:hypothetical protein